MFSKLLPLVKYCLTNIPHPTQDKNDLDCIANELRTLDNELSLQQLQLGSHGLIAGMVDELGLPELIDVVIKQDHE
jgi:hypothetical protein